MLPGEADERQVSLVERPHRRDERHASGGAPRRELPLQGFDRARFPKAQWTLRRAGASERNVSSAEGNPPERTSSENRRAASRMTSPRLAYRRTNFGRKSPDKPSRSWNTSTWPSQWGPAPIPIVGIESSAVILAASESGTHSRTTGKHPAFS